MTFFKQENLVENDICQKVVYISKSVKNMKLLPAEKFGTINSYQQTVSLKIIDDFKIEISFIGKQKFFIQNAINVFLLDCG